ncbi:uncharacterized protein LOC118159643, partial [Oxyura jamaicensis]|uniref:uncharacterized protein LOC118159643 n=1 Tax=Oxyura jamaicensis TaxID=8884 RepID=UPI0015A7050C
MENYAERLKNLEDTKFLLFAMSASCVIVKVMSSGLAGNLVRSSISRQLVWAKGSRTGGAGTASLALVRGFILSPSRGYAKAAPLCPGSSSSPPGHQQALVTCRASTLSPCAPSSPLPPEGPLSRAARAAQLSSTLGTLRAACLPSLPSFFPKEFGEYLLPSERLDVILTALEALQDASIHDKHRACSVLDVALEDPDYWLTNVPMIMECIRKNLDSIHMASARHCLDSLLLQLIKQMPREEVQNLLQFSPPSDSTALGMWEVVLAMPQTVEKVLNLLMEDLPLCNWCTAVTEDTCIRRLAVSSPMKPCSQQ